MKQFLLVLTVIFQISVGFAAGAETLLLFDLCDRQGGKIVENWTCPNSGKVRSGYFCHVQNKDGQEQIYNGCTNSIGGGGTKFFQACVIHDLCYHNEPRVSGRTKEQCDQNFYHQMKTICDQDQDSGNCKALAWTFYQAVSHFGSSSWSCAKNAVPYTDSIDFLLHGKN